MATPTQRKRPGRSPTGGRLATAWITAPLSDALNETVKASGLSESAVIRLVLTSWAVGPRDSVLEWPGGVAQ